MSNPLYINAVFDAQSQATEFYGDCRRDGVLFVPTDLDSPLLVVTLATINLPNGGTAATLAGTSLSNGSISNTVVGTQTDTCITIPYDNSEDVPPLTFTINISFANQTITIDPTVINVDPPGGGADGDPGRRAARARERAYHHHPA